MALLSPKLDSAPATHKNFRKCLEIMSVYVAFNYFPFQLPGFSFETDVLGLHQSYLAQKINPHLFPSIRIRWA